MAKKPRISWEPAPKPNTTVVNGDGAFTMRRVSLMNRQAASEGRAVKRQFIQNLMTARTDWLNQTPEGQKDVDKECGYPLHPGVRDYKKLYERFGPANRLVALMPAECFSVDPEIYDDEDPDKETPFEAAIKEIDQKHRLIHFMERIDEMSGLGRFGVLLFGIDDGRKLSLPVRGINAIGEKEGDNSYKLLFIRAFDESLVKITKWEKNTNSPRHGWPLEYEIKMSTLNEEGAHDYVEERVHWTRVIHVADNCRSNEALGTPRMKSSFNTLLDLKKVGGGSAEMFWKGAFPGIVFEVNSDEEDPEMDVESVKDEFYKYSESLQRYMAIEGVTAKQLAPQVADPESHIKMLLNFITIKEGCPLRVFMGSEAAHLAADQDQNTWRSRVRKRQVRYVESCIVRRVVDYLMVLGVVPAVKRYKVYWPDLHTPSEQDKATFAKTLTEAIAKYIATGAERLIPPAEFFTMILGFDMDQVKVVMRAAEKYAEVLKKRQEEEMRMELEQQKAMNPIQDGMQGPNAKLAGKGPNQGQRIRGSANPNGGVKKTNADKPISGKAA